MITILDLDALTRLIEDCPDPDHLYVRWSAGPEADQAGTGGGGGSAGTR
jgi:hypothetical protein